MQKLLLTTGENSRITAIWVHW